MPSPFQNTFSVWHALFLRECLTRLFGIRAGWAWLVLEPALHMAFLATAFTVIRQKQVGGTDVVTWIIIGMLAFFLFRRTYIQVLHSIDCNKAFFAFRQVRPFDVAFVNAISEGFVMTLISVFILGIVSLMGKDVLPHDPLLVIHSLASLWFLGLGFGMIFSVVIQIVPDMAHIFNLLVTPLYFISGVIMPLSVIPPQYRHWLLLNPVAHGIESVRIGFLDNYTTVPGIDLPYLTFWALILFTFGLGLYRAYETRLVTR